MDPVTAGLIGAGFSVGGNLVSGLITNHTNEKIAKDNLAFERENLEYQKELQNKVFDREDTAYQRTVNDMRASGLNPLAMKGTNGAGQAIQTTAPQNKYVADPVSFNNAMNTISTISSVIADNQNKKASSDLLNSQKNGQDIANNNAELIAQKELEKLEAEIQAIRESTNGDRLDNYDKENRNENSKDYHKEVVRSLTGNNDASDYELEEKRKATKENEEFWNLLGVDSRIDSQAKDLALDIMASTGFTPNHERDTGYVGAVERTQQQERLEGRHGLIDNILGLAKDGYKYGSNTVASIYHTVKNTIKDAWNNRKNKKKK